jgi:hypothetical protein
MRTASGDDSRQTPAPRLEITAARTTPATAPITVLMPRSRPDEQRDEDGRIGGGQHRSEQQRGRERQVEYEMRDEPGYERGNHHPGQHEQAEAEPDPLEHRDGQVQRAVEQDRRSARSAPPPAAG